MTILGNPSRFLKDNQLFIRTDRRIGEIKTLFFYIYFSHTVRNANDRAVMFAKLCHDAFCTNSSFEIQSEPFHCCIKLKQEILICLSFHCIFIQFIFPIELYFLHRKEHHCIYFSFFFQLIQKLNERLAKSIFL